jgi:alpha-mannosidase
MRAVANTQPGLPSVVMGRSVEEFFDDVVKKTNQGKTLPAW